MNISETKKTLLSESEISKNRPAKRWTRFGFYFLFLFLGTGLVALVARASIAKFFPSQCSGTWLNSEAAQIPTPDDGSEISVTDANSAILSGPVGSAITCSGFLVEKNPGRMLAAKLNLVWAFRSSAQIQNTESASSTPLPMPPVETKSEDEVSATPPAAEPPKESVESIAPQSGPEIPAPISEPQPPAPVETPTSPTVLPAETSESVPPTSFLKILLPVANAQIAEEAPTVTASLAFNGLEHFLDVQYSLDGGANWKSVDNADLSLPLTSFDDIPKVQIRILSLREGADLPKVYLRAMYLEARYIPEVATETSSEASSTVIGEATSSDVISADGENSEPSLLDTLTNAANDAVQAVADVVSGDAQTENPVIASTEPEKEIIQIPQEPELALEVNGGQDRSFLAALGKVVEPENNTLTVADGGRTLDIQGRCASKYLTVMVFEDKNDLYKDPARAIVNQANPCVDGKYSFTLNTKDLPSGLLEGSYSVILAEQEDNSKPKPTDAYEIRVSKKIIP